MARYKDAEEIEPELMPKNGWLNKFSSSLFTSWKRKYVVLENKKLKYYLNDKSDKPEGCIDFDLVNFIIKVSKKSNPLTFKIVFLNS